MTQRAICARDSMVVSVLAAVVAAGLGRPATMAGGNATALDVPFMHTGIGNAVYVVIQIGTPPQEVAVLFDTGSSTLAVPGPATQGANPLCKSANQYLGYGCSVGQYDPTQSTSRVDIPASGAISVPNLPDGTIAAFDQRTGQKTNNTCGTALPDGKCGGAVVYGTSGDTTGMEGYWVADNVTLGNLSATVGFISITEVTYSWQESPCGGIMGVSSEAGDCLAATMAKQQREGSPETCATNVLHLLLEQNGYGDDKFGLCLGHQGDTGVLSLGGANPNFYSGEMVYTPLLQGQLDNVYYAVTFTQLTIAGQTACNSQSACSGEVAVLDSGTDVFVLNYQAYLGLEQAAQDAQCTTDDDCEMRLQLDGVCLQPTGFFSCSGGRCQAKTSPEGTPLLAPTQGETIIGYPVLSQLYLLFDRGQHKAGFAVRQGECATPCSAFVSEWPCTVAAQCQWTNGVCGGTQPPNTIDEPVKGARAWGGSCSSPPPQDEMLDIHLDA